MITLTREEAQQVLDALTYVGDAKEIYSDTIETLRARLAQTKHWSDCAVHSEPAYHAGECDCGLVPVAWADKHDIEREGHDFYVNRQQPAKDGVPLYTAPPQREEGCAECGKKSSDGWALYCVKCSEREWQGLTNEEIKDIFDCGRSNLVNIKKAEQKLKEKNT